MRREAFLQTLAENHELRNDIEARVIEQLAQPDTVEEFDWDFLDKAHHNSSLF